MTAKLGLDDVFDLQEEGQTASPAQRAKASPRLYVRSQDHLAEYREGASGRVLSAWEAFDAFGVEVLAEVAEYGSAILVDDAHEPAYTLKKRRKALGLTARDVALKAKLSESEVAAAELTQQRSPIRTLERIAAVLGLDERLLSFRSGSGGDDDLAVRLRQVKVPNGSTDSPRLVGALSEAGWVIRTQIRLERWLGSLRRPPSAFTPSSAYGSQGSPAWKAGYVLAHRARQALGIPTSEPVPSLRELCVTLGIPIVQTALPQAFAGATVSVEGGRGIVVNTVGRNENVWVRRATVAHELGHLLWDPEPNLRRLTVDSYGLIEQDSIFVPQDVEARANAFAIEFLAPQAGVRTVFPKAGGVAHLRQVMETYGISFTSARHHVNNAWERALAVDQLKVQNTDPTADWYGRESYTQEWFPIESTPLSRRGRFAGVVAAAEQRRLITADTAASYLNTTREGYLLCGGMLSELFPIE